MRACSALIVLLVAATLAACGKPGTATNDSTTSNAAPANKSPAESDSLPPATAVVPVTSEILRYDAAKFTLGDYLPPLDGGKIEVAVPAGWEAMPRDRDYLVRFYDKEGDGGLPRIDVTVDDNNLGGLTSLTEANVVEFTAAVAKDLEANGTVLLEPPIPMVLGSVPCARYVSRVKLKIGEGSLSVERQTLVLLQAGRLYKINLLILLEKLTEASRDAAYAVCAGARFPATEPVATE